jgi:hypothetical protein
MIDCGKLLRAPSSHRFALGLLLLLGTGVMLIWVYAGLDPVRCAPSPGWVEIRAQSSLCLYVPVNTTLRWTDIRPEYNAEENVVVTLGLFGFGLSLGGLGALATACW